MLASNRRMVRKPNKKLNSDEVPLKWIKGCRAGLSAASRDVMAVRKGLCVCQRLLLVYVGIGGRMAGW